MTPRWKTAGVVGIVVLVLVLGRLLPLADWVGQAVGLARGAGPWGAVGYAAVYALAVVLGIPGSALTLGAGVAWGPFGGFAVVWPGAVVGAIASFLLGRTALRERVARRVAGVPVLRALDDALAREGGRVTLLLRLSPLVPFGILNYALGVTRVPFVAYTWATAIGIVPGTLLYAWLGAAAGEVGLGSGEQPAAQRVLFVVGLLATLAATVLVTRSARRALEARIEPGAQP